MQKAKLTCTYLYEDGHAIQIFEKHDPDAGEIRFCEVHEKFTKADCRFTGRLVIGRWQDGLAALLKTANDRGSDKSRQMGIAVGSLSVNTKAGELYWYTMPELISPPFSYQPDNKEQFDPGLSRWCDMAVARIHRVKTDAQLKEAA